VLGYDVAEYEAVVDPTGARSSSGSRDTDAHEEPRQRFHVDVTVPPDQAQTRIDAAVAAGGTLVSTDRAPAWTVLADPEGNKVCVCTWQGREAD
jgi:4a-hydroxytetrahydrobiopterin dehydratase